MGPGTKVLKVEGPVEVKPLDADLCEVTLHAPPHIDDRRAFIAELRAWAEALQSNVDYTQRGLDHMNGMDPDA